MPHDTAFHLVALFAKGPDKGSSLAVISHSIKSFFIQILTQAEIINMADTVLTMFILQNTLYLFTNLAISKD